MKAVGKLKPTATTYGCLLKVCGLRQDVTTAFKLYEEAFEVGVLATDECHNMLIDVCSDAGRWGASWKPQGVIAALPDLAGTTAPSTIVASAYQCNATVWVMVLYVSMYTFGGQDVSEYA